MPSDKDLITFVELVAEMRSAQDLYFKTRSPAQLQLARRIEKAVDAKLREFSDKQPRLFSS